MYIYICFALETRCIINERKFLDGANLTLVEKDDVFYVLFINVDVK